MFHFQRKARRMNVKWLTVSCIVPTRQWDMVQDQRVQNDQTNFIETAAYYTFLIFYILFLLKHENSYISQKKFINKWDLILYFLLYKKWCLLAKKMLKYIKLLVRKMRSFLNCLAIIIPSSFFQWCIKFFQKCQKYF